MVNFSTLQSQEIRATNPVLAWEDLSPGCEVLCAHSLFGEGTIPEGKGLVCVAGNKRQLRAGGHSLINVIERGTEKP